MDCISIPAQVPYSMVGSLSKMIKGDLNGYALEIT